ncbi:MAG: NUDIX hydrolase [Desulfobacteraceae bacterium]|nr:MAG: NUDIX hydrolase [Desulfobacteraceae bacterium]
MIPKLFCHFCGTSLTDRLIEGRVRRFCSSCQAPIYENPVPAVCLVTINARQQVLLVKRSVDPQKGFWCLPGGFMELHETPEGAGLRELREETGLCGKIDRLLGVTAHHSRLYGTVFVTGFLVTSFSGGLIAGDDADEAGWFAADNLPEIAFDSHRKFIRIYYTAYANSPSSNS